MTDSSRSLAEELLDRLAHDHDQHGVQLNVALVCSDLLVYNKNDGYTPIKEAVTKRFLPSRELPPDTHKLLGGWLSKAHETENVFEAFIYAWIAFNGWAAAVTGQDDDRQWKNQLTVNNKLQDAFAAFVVGEARSNRRTAFDFHECWPVLRMQSLRRAGVPVKELQLLNRSECRTEAVKRLIKDYPRNRHRPGVRYEPWCAEQHGWPDNRPDLNWPHTLAVLYRVRCNLFHGDKAIHSDTDREVVSAAYHVLTSFLKTAGYLESIEKT